MLCATPLRKSSTERVFAVDIFSNKRACIFWSISALCVDYGGWFDISIPGYILDVVASFQRLNFGGVRIVVMLILSFWIGLLRSCRQQACTFCCPAITPPRYPAWLQYSLLSIQVSIYAKFRITPTWLQYFNIHFVNNTYCKWIIFRMNQQYDRQRIYTYVYLTEI